MTCGAFLNRGIGGRGQTTNDLALGFIEFAPRAQTRRVATRAGIFVFGIHRARCILAPVAAGREIL
jgi:hypothetical protein